MTEETAASTKGMVPPKPYFALFKNANTAALYDNEPKRIMYISACEVCRHRIEGAEDGGALFDSRGEGIEEDLKWYYCKHPAYSNWPKRIGQLDKCKEIPYFCPLESMVKVDDSLIKVEEGKKSRRVKNDPETSKTINPSTAVTDGPVTQTTNKTSY